MSTNINIVEKEFSHDFFDNASDAWRNNKKKTLNGIFEYKCCYVYKNKKRCTRKLYRNQCIDSEITGLNKDIFCKLHINKKYIEKIHLWK